jgi:4-alpha-glucanotransferase
MKELRFLSEFAGLPVPENGDFPAYDDSVRRALLEALLASNARFAAFMLSDLFALEDRFNVPGIASGDNWSARLPMTVAQMRSQAPWKQECSWLRQAIRRTGR